MPILIGILDEKCRSVSGKLSADRLSLTKRVGCVCSLSGMTEKAERGVVWSVA